MTRIVCGLPGATSASSSLTCGSIGVVLRLKIVMPSSSSRRTAEATVAAHRQVMIAPASTKRLYIPHARRGGPSCCLRRTYLPPKRLSERAIASICLLVKVFERVFDTQ